MRRSIDWQPFETVPPNTTVLFGWESNPHVIRGFRTVYIQTDTGTGKNLADELVGMVPDIKEFPSSGYHFRLEHSPPTHWAWIDFPGV